MESFLDLIPARPGDLFTGAELGIGAGWLTKGILQRFPQANMIGFDGSETMRMTSSHVLAAFSERAEVRPFQLEDSDWRGLLPAQLNLVVSCLVIHHLDGPGKRELFADLFRRLAHGGALLICDVVQATSDEGRRAMAIAWDVKAVAVHKKSLEIWRHTNNS